MGQVKHFSKVEVAVGSGDGGSVDAMAKLLHPKKDLKKWL